MGPPAASAVLGRKERVQRLAGSAGRRRSLRASIALSLFACTIALPALAAQPVALPPAAPIVIGQTYTLLSKVLGGERRLSVYLPEHYADPGRSFPVLFLLDGGEHEDFHHITGLAQINAAYGAGQELIVVGIQGVDRRHDLTSPSRSPGDRKVAPTSGGAAAYRRFLVEEVKPWAAARFKADGRTALIGESLAGLFTAETLLREPRAFDDYIAVSPSLWWDDGALSREAVADLKRGDFSGRRAWIAFDEPAPPAEQAAAERRRQDALEAALKGADRGLWWRVERPCEGHASIYHPAALQAFRALFGAKETTATP